MALDTPRKLFTAIYLAQMALSVYFSLVCIRCHPLFPFVVETMHLTNVPYGRVSSHIKESKIRYNDKFDVYGWL